MVRKAWIWGIDWKREEPGKEREPRIRNSAKIVDGSQSLDPGKVGKEKNPGKNGNRGEDIRENGGGDAERILKMGRLGRRNTE
jgi:hypothetical protein